MRSGKYHSPKEYLDAARSEETSVEELGYLASSEYDFVKISVIKNVKTSTETLGEMVPENCDSWNEQEMAAALVENPKTAPETLREVAKKLIPYMRRERNNDNAVRATVGLFSNDRTPVDILQTILDLDQISTLILRTIARETSRKDVLNLLVNHKSEAVRKRALSKLEILK